METHRTARAIVVWAAVATVLLIGIQGLYEPVLWSRQLPGVLMKWGVVVALALGILATLSDISAGITALRKLAACGLNFRIGRFRVASILRAAVYATLFGVWVWLGLGSIERHKAAAKAFFQHEVKPIVKASEDRPFDLVRQRFIENLQDPDHSYDRDRELFRRLKRKHPSGITKFELVWELRKDPELSQRYSVDDERFSPFADFFDIDELTVQHDSNRFGSVSYYASAYVSRRRAYVTLHLVHQHIPLVNIVQRFDSTDWTIERVWARSKPDGELVSLSAVLGLPESELPVAFRANGGK